MHTDLSTPPPANDRPEQAVKRCRMALSGINRHEALIAGQGVSSTSQGPSTMGPS